MKTLGDYLAACGALVTTRPASLDLPISLVVDNSAKAVPGALFVAIDGAKADGRRYASDAVSRGAVAVVCRDRLPADPGVPVIGVSDDYAALGRLAECQADYPARRLKTVAITGTNGKTTTAFLLQHILTRAVLSTGMIGTVEYRFGEIAEVANRTTPTPLALQALYGRMVAAGMTHLVIEASSHALAQRRMGTVPVECAVFTNLSRDHGDYHPTMEDYFGAKGQLFREQLRPGGTAVVNADCPWGARLLAGALPGPRLSFALEKSADLTAVVHETGLDGYRLTVRGPGWSSPVRSPLTADYNVSNALGAIGAALSLGIDPEIIVAAIADFPGVPGRLQRLDGPRGLRVFVDYAHTDDALAKATRALKPHLPGRLVVVFGCGGDRDVAKRPLMARAAAALADEVIVTSDNPRTEEPERILDAIVAGFAPGQAYRRIADRRAAIWHAVTSARENDTVLLAGKGHEAYQEIHGIEHPFSDVAVATEALSHLGERS